MNCKLFCNNLWISPLLPLLHNTTLARGLTNSFVECKSCVVLELFFTFMLPCIVIDFFLNNQPDALIIQIYSVIKLYIFLYLSFRVS